jgi:membrane associated rhomboid family serine protease/Tfp pilus assembly protein PilF
MDQATDTAALVERGDEQLVEGQVTEAAADYSRALERDPNAERAHLGIAKAYLALGSYGYVNMACQRVLQLAPNSADAAVARAILFVLERHYDSAIKELERAEQLEPGQAYVHALRGYCYRQLGNSYDAVSAESKAARLSGHREWDHLFPKPQPATALVAPGPAGSAWSPSADGVAPVPAPPMPNGNQPQGQGPRPWDERRGYERTMVRARWATRGRPVVTLTLIGINLLVYAICAVLSQSLLSPAPDPHNPASLTNPLYLYGESVGSLMQQDPLQAYRLVTAMFLHANYIHIGLNMWSLYVVGMVVEQVFGAKRYLILYFATGLIAGIAQAVLAPDVAAIGASGAIFGIFGAFGAFVILRRRALGPAANAMIGQWLFFVVINLVFSAVDPQIALYDHVGGLVSGIILGAIFVAGARPRRRAPASPPGMF